MQIAVAGASTCGVRVARLAEAVGRALAAGNRHLTVTLPTGLGWARNVLVAGGGDALIALPGRDGTRSEIALARVLGRPVITLGRRDARMPGVQKAATAEEAVRRALAAVRRRLQSAR